MPRALISVSDKTGLTDFATRLAALGWELVSTGGTARALRAAGLATIEVSEVTGFPEMMDGRVKTLHPLVHGGLLARRDDPAHMQAAAEHGITPIDMVVVNLYPFRETVAREGVAPEDVIEQIDIGGPSMLRSAAKNFDAVTVIVDPADYAEVITALEGNADAAALRRRLAAKVYAHTAAYDGAIAAQIAGAVSRLERGVGGGDRERPAPLPPASRSPPRRTARDRRGYPCRSARRCTRAGPPRVRARLARRRSR